MRLNKNFHQLHSLREQEVRRRVFWACFLWDRLLASSLFKPCILIERNINVALPGTDVAFAYGEASRRLTLLTVGSFTGPPSDIGIGPYLIVTVHLWSNIADWHIGDNRLFDQMAPTDPQSEFHKRHTAMQAWISALPAWLQWSEQNYAIHKELSQERQFIILHLLRLSSMCVAHQAYLPHNNGPSMLLDTVDGAGLSLLHDDPALIAPCVANAMAAGEMVAWLIDNDPLAEQRLRSPWVGVALLSASAGLLWLQYNDSQQFNLSSGMAEKYLEYFDKLFECWKPAWNVASEWFQILKGMKILYRMAYLGEITGDTSQDEISPDELGASTDHEERQYYPRPGDGLPPMDTAAPLYTLLRENIASPIHQSIAQWHWIWLHLAGTWPRSFSDELVQSLALQDQEGLPGPLF
ncbi:transcription factor (predicted) [Penicillium atrosanguineum]|uniref:Transcription factor (Predicted) n=1 Tax=Penicillium atrosanguineum TaxID=1132637 RepID=A0A9W9Q4J2_9EURO|nr:transcription factor (predicted) [Penicillium atrosanguineum]KAJ5324461.1 transcription factor (predicted) [Penicillium atrosanguineum]